MTKKTGVMFAVVKILNKKTNSKSNRTNFVA